MLIGLGARPCFGTKIAKGELRLGEPTENDFVGDGTVTYRWRHWQVSVVALYQMVSYDILIGVV
jgi:hypothetical protein